MINKKATLANIITVLIPLILLAGLIGADNSYAATRSKAPTISAMVSTDSYVKLSWKNGNIKNVRSHYIYRKEKDGSYKKIGTVSKKTSSFVDYDVEVGTKYYYKISNKYLIKNYYSYERSVTPIKITAPKLMGTKTYTTSKNRVTALEWESEEGKTYYVYRKSESGSWQRLATVTAKGSKTSYTDYKGALNTSYLYTCKEVRKISSILNKYGSYEKGLAPFTEKPKVKADTQNLKAVISWDAVEGASYYKIYRKVGKSGSYRCIATTEDLSYEDVYEKSLTTGTEKSCLVATSFVDPSKNPLTYTVRAIRKDEDGTYGYSDYNVGGYFHIETPAVTSVTKNSKTSATIDWGTVPNADLYYVYSGYSDSNGRHWTRVGSFKAENHNRMRKTVNVNSKHNLFTVKAKFTVDGKTEYSKYDTGFRIDKRKYSKNTVLFFGDSITYGSPYKGKTTRVVFSYPWRVQQLTGIKMYNPSIPGATYADSGEAKRYRMVKDVADVINKGETPKSPNTMRHDFDTNTRKFKDFDVVVMACGTNDYSDNVELGDLNSSDRNTFNGAVNQVMAYIKEGNAQRVKAGKAPTKVVFVELFYSDRTGQPYGDKHNRFVTENGIGLTLTDYQNNLNDLTASYAEQGFDIYNFDTTKYIDENTCPYRASDNLHMSRYTYTQIGNGLADFLISNRIIK